MNATDTPKARAKKARERRTSIDAQKPFVETLRVGIPSGKAGTSSRKRVLRAVVGDHQGLRTTFSGPTHHFFLRF